MILVSKMSLNKFGFQWKDEGGKKSGCMNACGIFFNCIISHVHVWWDDTKYHTYPTRSRNFFGVLKSKINMGMLIEYGATAIIAKPLGVCEQNHIYFKAATGMRIVVGYNNIFYDKMSSKHNND